MLHSGRQHPVKLFSYTTRYFWLLLIPLARSIYSLVFENGSLRDWLSGAWLDLLVLGAIFCFAWLRWLSVGFEFDSEKITVTKGIYITVEDTVYYSKFTTLSIKQGLLYRALGAAEVYIATNAGALDRADVKIVMRRGDADKFYEAVKCTHKKSLNYSITPHKLRLLLFSALFSSTLSGVLIIIALLIQTGRVFDREVEAQLIFNTLSEAVNRAAVYVPPIIAGIILLISTSWVFSFMSNIVMFWNFVLTRCQDCLYVASGLITRNRHIISRDRINYVDLKQSFLSKVFNVSSLHVHCAGYGSAGRNELSVVLPITTRKEIDGTLKEVFPEYPPPKIELKSDPRSYGGFYFCPLILATVPVAGFAAAYYFLPSWYLVAYPAVAITLIPSIWLAMCKTLSMFITGVGFSGGYMTLRYSKWFTFHTIVAPVDRITKVVIRQSIPQKIRGTCSLRIYTQSDSKMCHTIYGLRLDRALSFLDRRGFDLYFSENPRSTAVG